MQICLMRHGRPDIPTEKSLSPFQFRDWVKSYGLSGVALDSIAPPHARQADKAAQLVLCSDLKRSVESCQLLGRMPDEIDPLFREAELPSTDWHFPKLRPLTWAVLFRLAWFAGYARGGESRGQLDKRASKAADRLIQSAMEHERILLIGHGMLNHFIARRLRMLGWETDKKSAGDHWSTSHWTMR